MVNDKEYSDKYSYSNPLSDQDAEQIGKILLEFSENFAKLNKCNTLEKEIHSNSIFTNKFINDYKFIVTDEKSKENHNFSIGYKHL